MVWGAGTPFLSGWGSGVQPTQAMQQPMPQMRPQAMQQQMPQRMALSAPRTAPQAQQGRPSLDQLFNKALYGDRYIGEAATPMGRQRLSNDFNATGQQMATNTGLYRTGDTDSRVPAWVYNKDGSIKQETYKQLFAGGNSYFIPDNLEMNPYLYMHGNLSGRTTPLTAQEKAKQDATFNQQYYGQRLINNVGNNAMQEDAARGFLNKSNLNDRNFLLKNRHVPLAFDVQRGDLTNDQANAVLAVADRNAYGVSAQDLQRQSQEQYEKRLAELNGFDPAVTFKYAGNVSQAMIDQYKSDLAKSVEGARADLDYRNQALKDYQASVEKAKGLLGGSGANLSSSGLLSLIGLGG